MEHASFIDLSRSPLAWDLQRELMTAERCDAGASVTEALRTALDDEYHVLALLASVDSEVVDMERAIAEAYTTHREQMRAALLVSGM